MIWPQVSLAQLAALLVMDYQVEIVDAREDTECPGCLLLTLEIADCCLETMLMPALASLAVGTPHIVAQ